MKLHYLLPVFGVLALAGCKDEKKAPPPPPAADSAKPAPAPEAPKPDAPKP